MTNIFEILFQYGFHDTEISSIECENLEIKLNFNNGVYLLDENGKETILSKPMQIILKINPMLVSFDRAIEIKEYRKKLKYIEYSVLEKYFKKETFGISMVYYSNFDKCILFEGGFYKRLIMFYISGIDEIIIRE